MLCLRQQVLRYSLFMIRRVFTHRFVSTSKPWANSKGMVQGHGSLARYVKLRVAHAPRRPGTFSPPARVGDPNMHHGTRVTHVPLCMTGSLTGGSHWGRWRGIRFRHSQRMRSPQFYASGKRPMGNPRSNYIGTRCETYRCGSSHCCVL